MGHLDTGFLNVVILKLLFYLNTNLYQMLEFFKADSLDVIDQKLIKT